jgi:hypothetical protein
MMELAHPIFEPGEGSLNMRGDVGPEAPVLLRLNVSSGGTWSHEMSYYGIFLSLDVRSTWRMISHP